MTTSEVVAPRPRFGIYPGPILAPVVGVLTLLFSIFIWSRDSSNASIATFFFAITAMMFVLSAITIARYLGYRVTAAVHDHAVVFNGREFRFDQIDFVTLRDRARVPQMGGITMVERTLTIAPVDGKKKSFVWIAEGHDPIAPVVEFLHRRLADEAPRRTLHGKRWSIVQMTLQTQDDMTPLSTLSGAGIYDREVRLWRRGETTPFFAAPVTSENAHVLLRVAEDAVAKAPPAPAAAPTAAAGDDAGLGRLLFARKPSGFVNVFSSIIYGLFGVAMALYAADHIDPQLDKPAIYLASAIAIFFVLRALHSFTVRYRFYELGVISTYVGGRREVRYADVETMSWGEVRSFHNGIYTGTSLKVKLAPAGGKPLHIRLRRFRVEDGDLGELRSAIATLAADRLQARFQAEGSVPWTRNARLRHDGVELKRDVIVRYDDPVNMHFGNGFMHFYREKWNKPIRILSCAEENFWPGYELYMRLRK